MLALVLALVLVLALAFAAAVVVVVVFILDLAEASCVVGGAELAAELGDIGPVDS